MNKFLPGVASLSLLATTAFAQNVAIFPDEYVDVPEGPGSSPNLPLARGTSRVQCLYDAIDLDIPSGHQITRVGFREDGVTGAMDVGVAMQLEIRMGWSTFDHQTMTTNFDNNYDAPPVTVFGPVLYTPPNLRDPGNPLPNGQFFIDLTTPFSYVPAGRNLVVEYRVYGTANGGAQFTYRLDRADYYSPTSEGPAGCPHSGGGVPHHTVQPCRPGIAWSGSVTQAPANAPGLLVVNIGQSLVTPYPLGAVFAGISPTCMGQMPLSGSVMLAGASGASGSTNWSFTIPNDNLWADMPISSQTLFLDFFTPGQVTVSNGAEVLTGVRNRTSILAASGVPTVVTTGSKSIYYCPVAFFQHQ